MVSVCMATYNGEKYIKEQLDSILVQLEQKDEVIISDDGSSDATVNIINSYSDKRIKLVINHGSHGYTSNFYNAIQLAQGDIILLSDQDDIWSSNKVSVMKNYLDKVDFVHSDAVVVNQDKEVVLKSRNTKYHVRKGYLPNLIRSRYLGCCMGFNKIIRDSIFPVPIYSNKYPHDLWIALVAEKYYRALCVDEKLVFYRRHDGNASDGGVGENKSLFSLFGKVAIRFYYSYYVIRQRKHIKQVKERFGYK